MNMPLPDSNTWLIVVFNCLVYAVMWKRRVKKATEDEALKEYQFKKMWKQYEKEHGINGNGDIT